MTNQKHYPDLGSDASSVRNFSARFLDFISRGNQWGRREMLAVFSGYHLSGSKGKRNTEKGWSKAEISELNQGKTTLLPEDRFENIKRRSSSKS